MPPKIAYHQCCMKREMPMTNWVKMGSSAPKLLKISSNWGMTNSSRMEVTMMATRMTMAG
ncbi:hypothetical protein D3C75_1134350 [compost metagenome]